MVFTHIYSVVRGDMTSLPTIVSIWVDVKPPVCRHTGFSRAGGNVCKRGRPVAKVVWQCADKPERHGVKMQQMHFRVGGLHRYKQAVV